MRKSFVGSYSGGKDSALAIHKAILKGYEPRCLFVTYDNTNKHSWFHNLPEDLLEQISKATGIPIRLIKTSGERYAGDFEDALEAIGVDLCVFGDVDIQEHFDWCHERCVNAGIESCFPLWGRDRKDLVCETVDSGFKAVITTVDSSRMSGDFLGLTLTRSLIERLEAEGVDVCGENGEYHTFVYDGPIFNRPINFSLGEIIEAGSYLRMPVYM